MISSAEGTTILVQVIVALVIARRSYSLSQGVPYSALRLVVVAVLIVVLWAVTELESVTFTPWAWPYLVGVDTLILLLTAYLSAPLAERMTEVERRPSGEGTVRVGFVLAAVFLALLVARLAIAVALLPNAFEFSGAGTAYPPVPQQLVVAVLDGLFSLSAGLLVGRSIGMRRRWESAARSASGTLV